MNSLSEEHDRQRELEVQTEEARLERIDVRRKESVKRKEEADKAAIESERKKAKAFADAGNVTNSIIKGTTSIAEAAVGSMENANERQKKNMLIFQSGYRNALHHLNLVKKCQSTMQRR